MSVLQGFHRSTAAGLRKRRLANEIKSRMVAERSGFSIGRFSEIERGLVEVSDEELARIEHALDALLAAKEEVKARAVEVGWPL